MLTLHSRTDSSLRSAADAARDHNGASTSLQEVAALLLGFSDAIENLGGGHMVRLLVLLALLIGSCIDVAAQSEIQNLLNEGRNLFYGARFGEAVRVLSAAEKLVDGSTSVADAAWVKVYLGASYYAVKRNDSAKKTFADICKIDRDFNITEKEFSPPIVDLFRLGEQQCVAEACETNCSAIRSAARNRDPDQIKKAVDAAGRCSCDDARQMAAQVVVENAIDNYIKQQYALAQTQFQLAVELNPVLRFEGFGFGKLLVTANGIGGRLFVDNAFKTELKPNEPYESPVMPAGTHKLRLEPGAAGFTVVEKEVNLESNGRVVVILSPQPATGSTRPGAASVDAQRKLQTATIKPRVLLDLETGNQIGAGADLMWIEINQIRHLIPQRRARVALLPPSAVFELITLDQLRRVSYPEGAIGAKDQPLRAGMIIAVQTADGSFAKLRIDSLGTSLAIRWIVYP